jgi:hypothetical protein
MYYILYLRYRETLFSKPVQRKCLIYQYYTDAVESAVSFPQAPKVTTRSLCSLDAHRRTQTRTICQTNKWPDSLFARHAGGEKVCVRLA